MLKKLVLATIASLMFVGGSVSAAPPVNQQFHLDAVGAIGADVNSGNIRNTAKQKNVSFQVGDGSPLSVQFSLDLSFWHNEEYTNDIKGSDCFQVSAVTGAIHVSETKNGTAKAVFWFSSQYQNSGGRKISYMLTLTAPDWTDGDATIVTYPPPDIDDSAFMLATAWEMQTEGKGKSRTSSCKGSGDFSSGTPPLLTVTQIPLNP